jgi:streptogramin lyase
MTGFTIYPVRPRILSSLLVIAARVGGCAGGTPQTASPTTGIPVAPPERAITDPSIAAPSLQEYPVLSGSHPHDVAPAPDGTAWYTGQGSGTVGRLDPATEFTS